MLVSCFTYSEKFFELFLELTTDRVDVLCEFLYLLVHGFYFSGEVFYGSAVKTGEQSENWSREACIKVKEQNLVQKQGSLKTTAVRIAAVTRKTWAVCILLIKIS